MKRERGEGGERGVLSLSDAMRALVEKTAAECEALQRELVFSLHGQASLRLLLGETSAAAALYHRVIGFARAEAAAGPRTGPGLAAWLAGPGKNGTLRLDALQHIHALHNLLEVHKTVAAGGGEDGEDGEEPASLLGSLHESEMERTLAQAQSQFLLSSSQPLLLGWVELEALGGKFLSRLSLEGVPSQAGGASGGAGATASATASAPPPTTP